MSGVAKRPDVDAVLSQLKDFQRQTVDHVFQRMFLDPDPAYRYLVADEVGLGKTLIARGVIARTIDHLWDRVGRLDVVYICSNGDIARQNVNRLNITGRKDFAIASRITLLPIQLRDLKANKVNFVSFTPGTSFELSSASGRADERVLLYWLLKHTWCLTGKAPLNLLQGYSGVETFRSQVDRFSLKHQIDADLARAFERALASHVDRDRAAGQPDLRSRFEELCDRFGRMRTHIPREDRLDQTRLIGDLRGLLAGTCIRALEPDLVILDEFQRFKSLLNGEDDASLLARELFDYSSHEGRARSLLLSATPYRMYTIADGDDGDDHHRDFLDTLRFLQNDPEATRRVAVGLRDYRQTLCLPSNWSEGRLESHKATLESELRRVIVRTERLAASEDRNGMLTEVAAHIPALETRDVMTYRSLQRIARALDHHDTLDYWKAAPYVLSFMDDYKLKRDLKSAVDGEEIDSTIVDALAADDSLCLPSDVISGKEPINAPHARVKWLLRETVDRGAWRLLWLPPSMKYYTPGGVFADPNAEGVTKRLIFSAWRIVPKALASIVSYEAERHMLESFRGRGASVGEVREKLVPLLRFARAEGRLTGMPVLGLLYPSIYLADVGDPLIARRQAENGVSSRDDLVATLRSKISAKLGPILDRHAAATGAVDESWYWAAPLLLDTQYSKTLTDLWLSQHHIAAVWSGQDPENPDTEHGLWAEHVARARDILRGREMLGVPPDDLADVLARLAIAGPAVTALRALARVTGGIGVVSEATIRNYAGHIAWGFRNLFNLPEAIGVVRGLNAEEPYWRRVLDYCVDGNLQSVLDEYSHVLKEASGLFGGTPAEIAQGIAEGVRSALGLRTSTLGVDEIKVEARRRSIVIDRHRMRTRFALRFGDDETEGEGDRSRADLVRGAFNSPFWPFVLATTAVGQEGLDFHLYCHSVVHWNLPSNPVDLEQREGRVHRYKGHAVRKNLASRYSGVPTGSEDPWAEMFERARLDRGASSTDLVPFWIYPVPGGAKIERQIPAFPLSQELGRLSALRRTLAVYRMVFGQPRQDELLEYLLTQMPLAEAAARMTQLRIDLSPASVVG